MAHIIIMVTGIHALEGRGDVAYHGFCRCTGMTPEDRDISFTTGGVDLGALATTVNDTIRDTAIAAAAVAGYTVGGLDVKTIIGAAVGL